MLCVRIYYGLTLLLALCHATFGPRKKELTTPSAGLPIIVRVSVSLCSTSNRKTLLSEHMRQTVQLFVHVTNSKVH